MNEQQIIAILQLQKIEGKKLIIHFYGRLINHLSPVNQRAKSYLKYLFIFIKVERFKLPSQRDLN